jgi:hypothetical protein
MSKRLMMIGLLGISLVAVLAAEANAQIAGWGYFGYSAVRGEINTIHTPPPQTKPTQLIATITCLCQIACKNPATNGVFPGKAFTKTASGSNPIGQEDITDTQGNEAKTEVTISLDQFEVNTNCTNPKWAPVPDSAMALAFSVTVTWVRTDTQQVLDEKTGTCTQNTTLYPRNPDGTAPDDVEFDCTPPQE